MPARIVDDTTTLQSTVAITVDEPIVAIKVCAIVLIALTVAALSHAFVFIVFSSCFY
jgi:ABC-type transport system involved in cytochrome bd biosynthesis fused ATPase/permease subunit